MVQVVDQTDCQSYDYRENNEQLAKENGELRQRLGLAIAERNHQLDELHRKNLEIVNLKSRLNELANIKIKYDKIALVVMEEIPLPGSQETQKTLRASESIRAIEPPRAIESPSKDSNLSSSSTQSADSILDEGSLKANDLLDHISEVSEQNSTNSDSLLTPRKLKDSLDPSCATSVPDIFDRTPCTPSVFNCLSTLKSPPRNLVTDQTLGQPDDEPRPDPVATNRTKNDNDDITSLKDHSIDGPDNNNTITNISNIEPNANNIGTTSVDCSPFSPNDDLSFRKTHSKLGQQQALFSSTPVQSKTAPKRKCELQVAVTKKKLATKNANLTKDNQENVSETGRTREEPKTRGRKRVANKVLSSEPPTPQPPAKRYNLRNRAKHRFDKF